MTATYKHKQHVAKGLAHIDRIAMNGSIQPPIIKNVERLHQAILGACGIIVFVLGVSAILYGLS